MNLNLEKYKYYEGTGIYPFYIGWWETANHGKIKIIDMETNHIINVIEYLKGHPTFYDEGGGCFDIDSYWYNDNKFLVDVKIQELKKELRKRKEKKWIK